MAQVGPSLFRFLLDPDLGSKAHHDGDAISQYRVITDTKVQWKFSRGWGTLSNRLHLKHDFKKKDQLSGSFVSIITPYRHSWSASLPQMGCWTKRSKC